MTALRRALALTAVATLLLAAGCSDDDADDTGGDGTEATAPASTEAATAPTPTEGTADDEVAASGEVVVLASTAGEVLVVDGLPLYAFDRDTPDASSCTEGCAQAWPPVAADTPLGEGVEVTIGSIVRDDGTEQLTINGAPVYTFATDEPLAADGSGEPLGQGASEVWWVVGADGNPIRDVPAN